MDTPTTRSRGPLDRREAPPVSPAALSRRERRLWPALVAHRMWSEKVATVTAVDRKRKP